MSDQRRRKADVEIAEVRIIAEAAKIGADDWLDTKAKAKWALAGAATIGAAGGTSISGFLAWLQGWFG